MVQPVTDQRYDYVGPTDGIQGLFVGKNLTEDQVAARLAVVGWERVAEKVSTPIPIERCKLAYWADKVGIIPIIGTPVGAVRLVCSVVIGIFSLLGALVMAVVCRCDLAKKCEYVFSRSTDEGVHGFKELFPLIALWHDCVSSKQEKEGYISTGARGRYIYHSPPDAGWLVYSQEKHEGSIWWAYPPGDHDGIFGFFERPTKEKFPWLF